MEILSKQTTEEFPLTVIVREVYTGNKTRTSYDELERAIKVEVNDADGNLEGCVFLKRWRREWHEQGGQNYDSLGRDQTPTIFDQFQKVKTTSQTASYDN